MKASGVSRDIAGVRRTRVAGTDPDIAQDLGPGTDQHAVANLGMTIALVLAGTPQGHGLQNGDIVAYHGSFTDYQASGVIQHDATAHARRWVNVDRENG